MPPRTAPLRHLLALTATLALAGAGTSAAAHGEVLLVLPTQAGPLELVAQRLREALAGSARLTELSVEPAQPASAPPRAVAWDLAAGIGALGERAARRHVPDSRLVSCAAPSSSAAGVVLEHDLALQFSALRRVLPAAQRVGLLFRDPAGRARADAAVQAARHAGLTPVPLAVESGAEAAGVADRAAADLDALMPLADSDLLAPQVARALLLVSVRQRPPLVGPAAGWSRAGALYALDWDWDDLGQQCADVARRMLARAPGRARRCRRSRRGARCSSSTGARRSI
ncbi:MAG: hypothetical protein MZW92_19350 [Comamonadaceae bacterium]|nr:hypothetical protein [Comamonadaceae bacterium]